MIEVYVISGSLFVVGVMAYWCAARSFPYDFESSLRAELNKK